MIEWGKTDFSAVIDHRFRGAVDQRTHVLDAIPRRFRPLGLQIFDVANFGDQFLNQHVDARITCPLAQSRYQSGEIGECLPRRRPQRILKIFARGNFREGNSGCARPRGEDIDGSVADAALRNADRAAKCLFVGRVGDQLEIRHQIANLPAVVEPHRAHEPVRNGFATQRTSRSDR